MCSGSLSGNMNLLLLNPAAAWTLYLEAPPGAPNHPPWGLQSGQSLQLGENKAWRKQGFYSYKGSVGPGSCAWHIPMERCGSSSSKQLLQKMWENAWSKWERGKGGPCLLPPREMHTGARMKCPLAKSLS